MFGNPAPVGGTGVTLTLSGANLTFYSDAACSTVQSNPMIPSGMSNVSFYATGTLATGSTVNVNAGSLGMATQPFTINAAAASKLVFTTAAQSIIAGTCSSIATVQTQDPYNNVSPVSGMTTLTPAVSAAGAVTFFSDACTTPLTSGIVVNT